MKVESNTLRALYDLIVIGSGPAGLTAAHKDDELTTGHKVLIVESVHVGLTGRRAMRGKHG